MSMVGYHLQNGTLPDRECLLEKLSDEAMVRLIPVMVILSFLGVVGSFGNVFVLVFYSRINEQTAFTTFIQTMCIADLAICCVAIPLEIYDMRYNYTFENEIACRVLKHVDYAASLLSGLTLVCIAIYRYRKVCKPFHVQVSLKKSRIICAILSGISLVVTTPAYTIYTNVKVNLTNAFYDDLQGTDCTADMKNAFVPIVVVGTFMIILFLLGFIILAVLYSKMGCFYYNHRKKYLKEKPTQNVPCVESSALSGNKDDTSISKDGADKAALEEGTSRFASFEVVTNSEGTQVELKGKQQKLDKESVRLIILMFIVSCVFILSFVPYLIILIWNFVGEPFKHHHTLSNLLGRTFILNSTVNPIIYGYFNSNFRHFVQKTVLPCVYK